MAFANSSLCLHSSSLSAEPELQLQPEPDLSMRCTCLCRQLGLLQGVEVAQDRLVWHQLLMQCSLRSCPAGTVVCIAGQPASQALWLLQGQVTVEAGSGHLQSVRQQPQATVTRRPNQDSQYEGSIFGTEVGSAWRTTLSKELILCLACTCFCTAVNG